MNAIFVEVIFLIEDWEYMFVRPTGKEILFSSVAFVYFLIACVPVCLYVCLKKKKK